MTYATHALPFYTEFRSVNDARIYEQLGYINHHARKRQNRLHPALHPTRAWLARRCGCSITTVSRRTSHLAKAGLLRKIQTKDKHGNWRPTWYWLAAGPADRIRYAIARAFKRFNRVSSMAHITRTNDNPSTPSIERDGPARETALLSWLKRARAGAAAGKNDGNAPPPAGLFGRGE